jgi:elongation factor 2
VKQVLASVFKVHSQLGLLHDGVEAPVDVVGWLREFNAKVEKRGGRPATLPTKVDDLSPRKALKLAMSALLPAADSLVEMIALHLPSPIDAQPTRSGTLTTEPSEDDATDAATLTRQLVKRCDPAASLLIYVSKICQPSEAGSAHGGGLAVCRCFSGTVRAGQVIQVAGSGGRTAKVTAVSMCVGKTMQSIGSGTAGQIFALSGVCGLLRKNGTLTDEPSVAPLRGMSFSVSPVVQKSVHPAVPRQLQKMVEALRKTVQADQTALFYHDRETNQHVLVRFRHNRTHTRLHFALCLFFVH